VANNLRNLGKTDIQITPIGLGVMQFSGNKGVFRFMFSEMEQHTMNQIIQAALTGGINWFDTAEMYGRGRSEQGLAQALLAADVPDENVLIATKWFPILRVAGNIAKTITDRQQFLAPYTIDLYQVHQPYSFSSPEAEMDAMADLIENGLIRSIGVSNFSAARMGRAHAALAKRGYPLASNQVQYHLLDRSIEKNGILNTAKELGITIIAWSPIASGLLSGKYHDNPELLKHTPLARRRMIKAKLEISRPLINAMREIGQDYGASIPQVALSWLVNFHGDSVVAIPGASKVEQAESNAGAMNITLSQDEMDKIDELSRQFI
jgi:aryl-alcohol dehydrogenase-like predicted oxidoreductase